jgi:acyl-coenzyme A synthetase/AMP-(fatty) acid ligase
MTLDPSRRRRVAPPSDAGLPGASASLLAPPGDRNLALFHGGLVAASAFQGQALALAECLPARRHVLNLCDDRHAFSLGFAAALVRGQITLLPPDRTEWTLRQVAGQFPDLYCLTDAAQVVPEGMDVFRCDGVTPGASKPVSAIAIPEDRIAAMAFTSGSTGLPQPHPKSWRTLCESARLIGAALGIPAQATVVATVPPQHMYGFELSVLVPLRCGAVLDARKPFFPMDVREALLTALAPRVLVTTPVHIRALLAAEIGLPPLDLIVSATAPLSRSLAEEAERRFGAPLKEIYGCTEAGSIASRRPPSDEIWTLFEGVRLLPDGGAHRVEADYLPGSVRLNDIVEPEGEGRFRLYGRMADLVNIAGKRSSLSALNHVLTGVEGVADGTFFLPEEDGAAITRLVAFAVAPGLSAETLLARLRQRLDPAFLPRALYLVEALPRAESGKLPRRALEDLAARCRASGTGER